MTQPRLFVLTVALVVGALVAHATQGPPTTTVLPPVAKPQPVPPQPPPLPPLPPPPIEVYLLAALRAQDERIAALDKRIAALEGKRSRDDERAADVSARLLQVERTQRVGAHR